MTDRRKIKITAEMIDAGIHALRKYDVLLADAPLSPTLEDLLVQEIITAALEARNDKST